MKRALLACLPLALAACGNIRVGSVPLPDITVVVPPEVPSFPVPLDNFVVYKNQNYIGKQSVPSLVNSVGIEGRAEYTGAGEVRTLNLYVRQNFDSPNCIDFGKLGQDYAQYAQYVVCQASGEGDNSIGGIDFPAGQPKVANFSLASDKIKAAARAGVGYFGMRVASGGVAAGDTLTLTNMRAVAKF